MSRFARILRGVAIFAGVLLLLLVLGIGAAVLLVDFDGLIAKYRDQAVAAASDALGREVQVEAVEPRFFPTFGIVARGVEIAGPPNAPQDPMLQMRALRMDISLMKALTSLGEEIAINEVVAVQPRISVSRDRQGRWSFADIQERLAQRPDKPMSPRVKELVEGTEIRRIAVEDGAISILDHAAPEGSGRVYASDVDAELRGVALGEPAKVSLEMALLAEEQNVALGAETTPLPESLEEKSMPSVREALLKIDGVPLAPLSPWVAADFQDARLFADLSADGVAERVRGTASIVGLSSDGRAPLEIEAETDARLRGDTLALEKLDLSLGEAVVETSGRVDLPDGDEPGRVDLTFDTNVIDLTALDDLVPGFTISAQPATVEASGRIFGPASAAGLTVQVERADLAIGQTKIAGSASVSGLKQPRIRFALDSPHLDLDKLRSAFETTEGKQPPKGPDRKRKDGLLQRISGNGTLTAATGSLAGLEFQRLDSRVRLDRGRVLVEALTFDSYGGRVSLGGSSVDLSTEPPAYTLNANLVGLEAGRLFAEETKLGQPLTGLLKATVNLSGRGTEWSAAASTLTGRIGGTIEAGRIQGINLAEAVIGPLAQGLPFIGEVTGIEIPSEPVTEYERLEGAILVDGGELTLRDPVRIETDLGTVVLEGTIGLDKGLALTGAYELSPETIASLTDGKVRPPEALPVGVRLGCTLDKPCVEGVAVEPAVERLVQMYAREAAEKATKEATKGLEEEGAKRLKEALGF